LTSFNVDVHLVRRGLGRFVRLTLLAPPTDSEIRSCVIEAAGTKKIMKRVFQRDVMRQLYQEFKGNKEQTVRAYAAAELQGVVRRASNRYKSSPEVYAKALLADGIRRGWLREPTT
jgi:hypothetical protein